MCERSDNSGTSNRVADMHRDVRVLTFRVRLCLDVVDQSEVSEVVHVDLGLKHDNNSAQQNQANAQMSKVRLAEETRTLTPSCAQMSRTD